MNKPQEINWINAVKAICIVFIYLNHSEFFCEHEIGALRNLYRPFFVNAFFIVSGYLLFRKQLSSPQIEQPCKEWMCMGGGGISLVGNILFKIAIPTILFTFITFFPKLYLRGQELSFHEMLNSAFLGNQYWFTCALVVAEFLLFIAMTSRNRSIWLYAAFGFSMAIFSQILVTFNVQFFDNPSMPWYYKSGLIATTFLSAGGIYWKYEEQIDCHISGWMLGIGIAVTCYVLLFHAEWVQCTITRGSLNVLGFMTAILLSYVLIRLCKLLPYNKFVTYVGRRSIGFYFFCGALPNITWMLLHRMGVNPSIGNTVLATMLSLAIALAVVYVLDKYLPFLFDLRKIISISNFK